ncbi:MAG TPA: chemotaxis protein CheB [Steroidobacteraceae bacterium]|nr:chemotaxis protein CheB [Steroidobacteraceae bacterium]
MRAAIDSPLQAGDVEKFGAIRSRIDAIVIGASAGGVDALDVLLPALPRSLRPAVFVVLHLLSERPSLLVEIFAPRCALPLREADDKEPVVPGTVYFAPPDYHLLVDVGPRLSLSSDDRVNFSRPSIDVLFESAADLYKERLLGIVLTGGSDDGAMGLRAIQRAGGVTLVQHPDDAQVPHMVKAALAHVTPDFVLSLSQIAALLKSLDESNAAHGKGH